MGIPNCAVVDYQQKIKEEQGRLQCMESYFNYAIDEEHIEEAIKGINLCKANLQKYRKAIRVM